MMRIGLFLVRNEGGRRREGVGHCLFHDVGGANFVECIVGHDESAQLIGLAFVFWDFGHRRRRTRTSVFFFQNRVLTGDV